MRRDLEALLFAADEPLSLSKLVAFFPRMDRKSIRAALEELKAEYDRDEHAFTVVEFGGGFSIATRPEFAPVVKKLFRGKRKLRLSKAGLEALSIIAYKQPVTRLEIEEIRGVQAQGVLGTLLERELIHIVGRAEGLGNPLLYGTTRNFLDYLGLRDLKELPRLSEVEDLLSEKEEIKQLAAQLGEELSDEELEAAARGEEDEEDEGEAENEVTPEASDSVASADDEAEAQDEEGAEDEPMAETVPDDEAAVEEEAVVAEGEAALDRREGAAD